MIEDTKSNLTCLRAEVFPVISGSLAGHEPCIHVFVTEVIKITRCSVNGYMIFIPLLQRDNFSTVNAFVAVLWRCRRSATTPLQISKPL